MITIFKFQQARLFYSVGIQGLFDYNVLAMLVNIAFNIFLTITVFYSLRALSLILKNQEEFQRLTNNPNVKSGMKKIFERSSQIAFSKEWEQYEKMDIQKELTSLIRKYPGLRLEISGILKLPIGKKKFSDLTMEQKLNFTLLQRALHPSKFQKLLTYSEPNTAKNIIKNLEDAKSGLTTDIEDQFQKMNLKHF